MEEGSVGPTRAHMLLEDDVSGKKKKPNGIANNIVIRDPPTFGFWIWIQSSHCLHKNLLFNFFNLLLHPLKSSVDYY